MPSFVVAGHLCIDLHPQLTHDGETFPGALVDVGPLAVSPGGSVANTGLALASLGAQVSMSATIGADDVGDVLMSKLEVDNVETSRVQRSHTSSTSYSIVIERPGIDRSFWHHTGANDEFTGAAVEVEGVDLLHIGYPSLLPGLLIQDGKPLHTLMSRARKAGVTTSLDLAVVDPASGAGEVDWKALLNGALPECDIASPSLDDLTSALRIDSGYSPALVDDLADWLLDAGVAVVAISAGRHGLRIRASSADRLRAAGTALSPHAQAWADCDITMPPVASAHQTANGAGDASTAGLLFGITSGAPPGLSAALAASCAAAVMSGERPTPAVVTLLNPDLAPLFFETAGAMK